MTQKYFGIPWYLWLGIIPFGIGLIWLVLTILPSIFTARYVLFDGLLNQTFLGLQFYIWLMLALFLLCAGTYAVWYFFFWMPLTPAHGHFLSHIYHTNSALTFDEHLNFVMRSEKKAKLIFDMTVKEAKELQKDWDYAPSGLIGRVLDDLIFDAGGWLKLDSPVRAEIERVASVYNDANPDDQIMTLGKFYRRLSEGKLGACPDIPRTFTVNWRRIDFAIPKDHVAPMWDGFLRQFAHTLHEVNNSDYTNYGYIILGGSILISLGMIAVSYLK